MTSIQKQLAATILGIALLSSNAVNASTLSEAGEELGKKITAVLKAKGFKDAQVNKVFQKRSEDTFYMTRTNGKTLMQLNSSEGNMRALSFGSVSYGPAPLPRDIVLQRIEQGPGSHYSNQYIPIGGEIKVVTQKVKDVVNTTYTHQANVTARQIGNGGRVQKSDISVDTYVYTMQSKKVTAMGPGNPNPYKLEETLSYETASTATKGISIPGEVKFVEVVEIPTNNDHKQIVTSVVFEDSSGSITSRKYVLDKKTGAWEQRGVDKITADTDRYTIPVSTQATERTVSPKGVQ